MNSPFDGSPLPVIRALGWSTVREIIDLESARIVYKSLNGDAPSYMSDMFTKVNVSTTRSLRNSDYDLRVPFLKTTTGQRCFSYRGAKLWNGLSKKTKNTPTLKKFYESPTSSPGPFVILGRRRKGPGIGWSHDHQNTLSQWVS